MPEGLCAEFRLQAIKKVAHGEPGKVLLIEPVQFFWIEDRVSAADALQREDLDQFALRKNFMIGSGRPAQEGQEVDHGLGQISEPLILEHGRRAVPFTQSFLVGTKNQRHVGECRHREVERAIKKNVLRRVRDVVVAPDDVGDFHVDVVDHDRQVIGRVSVGAKDDEVVQSDPRRTRCRPCTRS